MRIAFGTPRRAEPGAVRHDDRFAALCESQHDVLTRAQLLELDHSPGHLDAQVAARRWQRVSPAVYVLHNGPLTEAQQWWAAVLAVGPLAGRTALKAWGVTGWPSKQVEVVVPRGTRYSAVTGVDLKIHESRRLLHADVVDREPPRTGLERSAIDASVWTKDPRAACGLLAAVVQQRRTTAARLSSELLAAGQVRHRALLAAVLTDIEGGAQALSEVDLGRLCRRAGLHLERQVVRVVGGRRRYVDARVTSSETGRSVLVEVDGALHLVASSYWDDMVRGNELLIGGGPVLRFPSVALHLEPEVVIDQLRRACGLPSLPDRRPVRRGASRGSLSA